MHTVRVLIPMLMIVTAAHAAPPSSSEVLEGMLRAAGGRQAFAELGVIDLRAEENETLSDGKTTSNRFEAWIDTSSLTNLRLEMPPEVVLVRNNDILWAQVAGELDTRPQTPRQVDGTLNAKLFPLLLPFSLTMPGVDVGDEVTESEVEGTDTWRVPVIFRPGFFPTPVMNTTWYVHADRSDGSFVAAEFLPSVEFRKVADEGVRYRPLKTTTYGRVKLATQILMDGLDFSWVPNGHVRITEIDVDTGGRFDPRLFFHPDRLEELESDDIPLGPPSS
jgi:hypothetical protein